MSNSIVIQGDKVRILTSELADDPNIYTVDDLKRQVVYLTCQDTDRQVKVHKSRIREIVTKESEMSETESSVVTETETETHEAAAPEPKPEKPKRVRKVKEEPVPVDFDTPPFEDLEIWTKGDCEFDVATVNVEAHCVIMDEGYQTFNTYNSTLGKKGKLPEDGSLPGVFYEFNDKMSPDKKREALSKKGYNLR